LAERKIIKMKWLMMLVMASLPFVGCSPIDKKVTQMQQKEVVAIAEATAKAEGFDLTKYDMTGCHYQFTKPDGTWTVFFQMKPPTPPGGHFMVTIEDQTKKATLMRGE
jgi:hypothetical protein